MFMKPLYMIFGECKDDREKRRDREYGGIEPGTRVCASVFDKRRDEGHCFGLRRVHSGFSGHEKNLGKLLSAKALLAETEGFEPSCP